MSPCRCETCGAWGHRAKLCPLKRLNEMQETLGPRKLANQAANVTCPTCGALAGFRCVDHAGQIVAYHLDHVPMEDRDTNGDLYE
jgi:hypothetical protein